MLESVDHIKINFNPDSLVFLNAVIGIIMFGIALDIKVEDFKRVLKKPRAPLIGMLGQFVLLPAATFLLTLLIKPIPSIALGMILVASCPGGNVSNFITYLAGGNPTLSITMTAISTAAAVIMTPLNLYFWGTLNPATAPIYHAVHLDPLKLFQIIVMILGIPLALGMYVGYKYPVFAERARKPFKVIGIIIFSSFIVIAFAANWQIFLEYIGYIAIIVFIHNATALLVGYFAAKAAGLDSRDARTVSIEVGIQNSALGLVLIFTFFGGLGGMAVITAWWGVWHIIAGLSVAALWVWLDKRRGVNVVKEIV